MIAFEKLVKNGHFVNFKTILCLFCTKHLEKSIINSQNRQKDLIFKTIKVFFYKKLEIVENYACG